MPCGAALIKSDIETFLLVVVLVSYIGIKSTDAGVALKSVWFVISRPTTTLPVVGLALKPFKLPAGDAVTLVIPPVAAIEILLPILEVVTFVPPKISNVVPDVTVSGLCESVSTAQAYAPPDIFSHIVPLYTYVPLFVVSKTIRPAAGFDIPVLCALDILGGKKPLVIDLASNTADAFDATGSKS